MLKAGARIATEKADPPDRSAPAPSIRRTAQEAVMIRNQCSPCTPLSIRLLSAITIDDKTDCWNWTRALKDNGYGCLHIRSIPSTVYAHRLSWIAFRGIIPQGMQVLHRCDNRRCINPDHLFLGTPCDNVHDMDSKGRRVNSPRYADQHPRHKLTWALVGTIREQYSAGMIMDDIAEGLAISRATVSRVVRRVSWNGDEDHATHTT